MPDSPRLNIVSLRSSRFRFLQAGYARGHGAKRSKKHCLKNERLVQKQSFRVTLTIVQPRALSYDEPVSLKGSITLYKGFITLPIISKAGACYGA